MAADSTPGLLDTALLAKIGAPAPDAVAALAEKFGNSFPGVVAELEKLFAAGDFRAAADLLHQQKGASSSLGLAALGAALADMESSCDRHTAPEPSALAALPPLAADSLEAALAHLRSLS